MSLWTKTNPPSWFPTAVATERGWENPVTHEVLATLAQVADASVPIIVNIFATKLEPLFREPWAMEENDVPVFHHGDIMHIFIQFNEAVVVIGTPTINFSVAGNGRTATYAPGDSVANLLAFEYIWNDTAVPGDVLVASVSLNGGSVVSALPIGHSDNANLTVPVSQPHMALVTGS
jgi:hypothetical protein